MSVTVTDSVATPASFSIGTRKIQLVKMSALSGATSGTITADNLRVLEQVICASRMRFTAAKTYATNVATLAFTVPAETAASLVVQDITYTAVANQGAGGNAIKIRYITGGTAGSEVVTVTGLTVQTQIQTGVSTATQILTALNASAAALALITPVITGTGSNAQTAPVNTFMAGGVTGGVFGVECLCVGY